MHQLGGDSGVDTTADGTYNLTLLTTDLPNPSNLLGDKTLHAPTVPNTADVLHKGGNDFLAPGGVRNLGVELDTVNRLGFVGDRSVRGSRGGSDGDKVGGEGGKLVTMRHPDLIVYCQHNVVCPSYKPKLTCNPPSSSISMPSNKASWSFFPVLTTSILA